MNNLSQSQRSDTLREDHNFSIKSKLAQCLYARKSNNLNQSESKWMNTSLTRKSSDP